MKKVLQLSHKPPFPAIDGGCLEMAKMSNFFDKSQGYKLSILTYSTNKHPFNQKDFNHLSNTNVYNVTIDTSLSTKGALKGLLQNKSYHLSRFKSLAFKKQLTALLSKENYDYIVLESIFSGLYIDEIRANSKAHIILNSPNIEFEIWERLAKETTSRFKKEYLKKLAKQLKKEELSITAKVDGIIAISQKDEAYYNSIYKNIPSTHIPYLLNTDLYYKEPVKQSAVKLYHIGAMDWEPNIKGVEWFLNNIWKGDIKNNTNTSLALAGKSMTQHFISLANKNTYVQGFIDDAIAFHKANNVMIIPLFSGSGLRIKLIEAMATGNCVITTSVGAEGIPYTNNEHLIIANTVEEFKIAIQKLREHPEKIEWFGKNARKLAVEHFDSCILESKLSSFFKQL